MKAFHLPSLSPIGQTVSRICLQVCSLHGVILLSSTVFGYISASPVRFAYNVEGLKSMLVALGISALAIGLTERTARTEMR